MKTQLCAALLAGSSLFAATAAMAQTAPDQTVTPQQPSSLQQPSPEDRSPAPRSAADTLSDSTGASPNRDAAPGSAVDAPATDASATSTQDVVVTGSRLVTNGNNAPTPVTVVNADQILKLSGTTVTDSLNLLPALQGVFSGPSARPGGSQRNGAGSYLTLRNLGNLRTLILYDGQRLIPTINQNEADVDAQIVPQMLIKRVDIVTGGVAAVYGSDAITGVVNFITDRDFNGVKVQASNGISTYGDGRIFDVGVAAGNKFAGGRGHFEASYQYHQDNGIIARQNTGRSFFDRRTSAAGNGCSTAATAPGTAACVPYYNFDNALLSNFTYGGLINNVAANNGLRDLMFTPQGTLTPFVHGLIPTAGGLIQGTTLNAATGVPANVESGGSGVYNFRTSLKAGVTYHQAFGRLDYDLTDDIHAYGQVGVSRIHSYNNYQVPNITSIRISYANPYLDTALAPAALGAAGLTAAQITTITNLRAAAAANPSATANTFTFSRYLTAREPKANQWTDSIIGYAGLEGSLFDGGAKWNVNVGKSESKIHTQNTIGIDNGRLFASIDTVRSGGQIVCRASLTNAAYANCVPFNIFGEGQASEAAYNYIYRATDNWNRTRMEQASGSITGAPFSTWAGPVNMALSGEYRRLRWDVASNAVPTDLADCAGVALNCVTQTATVAGTAQQFFNTQGRLATATQRVAEAAYEVDVPLVKDVRFIQALNVTGAVRYTHYNTSGNVTTWKVGGDWQVNDDLRFRATRSRDIRAPNIFELVQPVQRNPGFTANPDPRTNAPQVQTFTNVQTGNPNLSPEKADTLTVGAVLKPSFIPRLSVSVDYFRINVKDAIYLLQGFNAAVLRACVATPQPDYCSIVTRDANGIITQTQSTYLNIATLKTWGIDTEVNYQVPVLSGLTLRAIAAYQPKLTFDQGPAGVIEAAGAYNTGTNRLGASPKWKLTGIASLDLTEDFTLSVLERWRSSLKATYDPNVLVSTSRLPALAYTTLNLDWHVKTDQGDFTTYFNVSNLFNKYPTVYYTSTQSGIAQGLPEGDDPVGRYFTVGVRAKF